MHNRLEVDLERPALTLDIGFVSRLVDFGLDVPITDKQSAELKQVRPNSPMAQVVMAQVVMDQSAELEQVGLKMYLRYTLDVQSIYIRCAFHVH